MKHLVDKNEINTNVLTHVGSMNYILQVWKTKNGDVAVDQYQPRKNKIWSGEMSDSESRQQIIETMERMKIAIELMQEYLDGKRDYVYYWEFD